MKIKTKEFEDGITLTDGNIRVRLFPNCITLSATNNEGMNQLNNMNALNRYCTDTTNTNTYRDALDDIHTIDIYFRRSEEVTLEGLEINT